MNHLQRLRDEQDDSLKRFGMGFNAFISWTVQIEGTPLGQKQICQRIRRNQHGIPAAYGHRRIFLDNIPHISASWPTQGAKVGQMSLHFGADDFGSTMIEENVVSAAGAITKASPVMLPTRNPPPNTGGGFYPGAAQHQL